MFRPATDLTFLVVITAAALFSAPSVRAAGCEEYPYTTGMNIEVVDGGLKIIATSAVGVSFDDVDAVNDARDEATHAAKAQITKFLQEGITSEDTINKAVHETKSMQGDSKTALRTEVTDRVKKLAGSASGMLRGVAPLGDCYTPKRELRVSVGVKPTNIAGSGATAAAMSQSLSSAPTVPMTGAPAGSLSSGGAAPSGQQPLNNVPGFANTRALSGF